MPASGFPCYSKDMGKSTNQTLIAKHIFDQILAKYDPESIGEKNPEPRGKNPVAQASGRLGGEKGGKARAAKLSAKKRKAIAKKAAQARWGKVVD